MKQVLVLSLVAVSALLLVHHTLAIQCFVCNSCYQLDCADWFDNVTHHLVTCQSEQTKCRKVVQELWLPRESRWDIRYIRQCAVGGEVGANEGKVCHEWYRTTNIRVRHCYCNNQDGCNTAAHITGSLGVDVAATMTGMWLVWRLTRSSCGW